MDIKRYKRKTIPFKLYVEIARRDNLTCQICGRVGKFRKFYLEGCRIRIGVFYRKKRFEIDHIIPLDKGGNNKLDNLQLTCMHCNRSKGTKLLSNTNAI